MLQLLCDECGQTTLEWESDRTNIVIDAAAKCDQCRKDHPNIAAAPEGRAYRPFRPDLRTRQVFRDLYEKKQDEAARLYEKKQDEAARSLGMCSTGDVELGLGNCELCDEEQLERQAWAQREIKDELNEKLYAYQSPPPNIGLYAGMRTKYDVEVRKLQGKSLKFPGTATDKVCHIKTAEIVPGIKVYFAIDAHGGALYIHPTADLTW